MYLRLPHCVVLIMGALLLRPALALAFDCAPTLCTRMTTCAEAYFKLEICRHTDRDADNDGIPCEELCGKDIATYVARAKAQWPKDMAFIPRRGLPNDLQLAPSALAEPAEPGATEVFSCAGKTTCKQMLSCEEAKFYLANCGARKLDGDGDGTPCNSLCR